MRRSLCLAVCFCGFSFAFLVAPHSRACSPPEATFNLLLPKAGSTVPTNVVPMVST
jgi:hypothetical protein